LLQPPCHSQQPLGIFSILLSSRSSNVIFTLHAANGAISSAEWRHRWLKVTAANGEQDLGFLGQTIVLMRQLGERSGPQGHRALNDLLGEDFLTKFAEG
jgi:hypothetical protein